MTLPAGWIEVHGWAWGDDTEQPSVRMLFQVKHLLGLVPYQWGAQIRTTILLPRQSHPVQESMEEVEALMLAALVGQGA